MAAPLTDEELQRYTQLVDAILSTADLLTVTRKKVRKGLERALGGKDLSDQKVAIKALIEARFDAINSQSQSTGAMPTPPLHPNHDSGEGDDDDYTRTPRKRDYTASLGDGDADSYAGTSHRGTVDREIKVSLYDEDEYENNNGIDTPAKKKHKRSSSSVEDADARLAAELQAQENRLARARTTRGGGTAKAAKPRKKAPAKKKSAAKVKDEDGGGDRIGGSDVDSDEVDAPVKRRGGGFQKPFNLSYQLGELVGTTQLSRPQVVKKLWEHIKGNNLQDPTDKRQIRCDDKMQAVFKQQRVDMFQMNKLLGNHLYPVDEE
ncbi:swib mdm2 domain containing protein [Niveomyces insectorum RCEF 264]|uniref:Swib mdm2 domain containing protein n=1 Tax=Niveomyces insectorum RCEF 264 TaxID=1081102 RepID=A0A167M4K3_9HYPO|nr:swib mdm2 domain containing protein [Niveomyces insectorum RCEF 264]